MKVISGIAHAPFHLDRKLYSSEISNPLPSFFLAEVHRFTYAPLAYGSLC